MRDADALPDDAARWMAALTWHETLTEAEHSRLTGDLIRDWQTWYADAENRQLFDRVSQLLIDGRLYRNESRRSKWADVADDYDTAVPVSVWRGTKCCQVARPPWQRPARRSRIWVAGGAAVAAMVAMVMAGAWLARSHGTRMRTHWSGHSATFQTDTGHLKNISLSDGSSITLDGNTKLAVTLSTRERSVELLRGEAWFRVAHDPKWPFVVHAGGGAIKAVGTAFLVTRDSDRVVVAVTEGIVAITPGRAMVIVPRLSRAPSSMPSRPIRVLRGQQVSYQDDGTVASVAPVDTRAATAWTHGRLVFDNEPLRYVIESLNRYSPQNVTATPSVGSLRFSGVVFEGEIQDWLHGLSQIFPVDVDRCSPNICIHMDANGTSPARRRDSLSLEPTR